MIRPLALDVSEKAAAGQPGVAAALGQLANSFVAGATGALLSRLPARVILSVGLGMTGLGLLMIGGLDPADGWTAMLGGFLVAGAGVGPIDPVVADVAVSSFPSSRAGWRPESTTPSAKSASP